MSEHRTCLCAKKPTEITAFPRGGERRLERRLVYHLVYHYSLGIHINHLIFLQTYMFGWALIFNLAQVYNIYAVLCSLVFVNPILTYCVNCTDESRKLRTALLVCPFLISWLFICVAGLATVQVLEHEKGFSKGYIALVGVAIILASFICQLTGHWLFEKFNAPPSLAHGFVEAPILEGAVLMLRCGCYPIFAKKIYEEVDGIRARASEDNYGQDRCEEEEAGSGLGTRITQA